MFFRVKLTYFIGYERVQTEGHLRYISRSNKHNYINIYTKCVI